VAVRRLRPERTRSDTDVVKTRKKFAFFFFKLIMPGEILQNRFSCAVAINFYLSVD
jgi:hypothetical protein